MDARTNRRRIVVGTGAYGREKNITGFPSQSGEQFGFLIVVAKNEKPVLIRASVLGDKQIWHKKILDSVLV